MLFEIKNLTKYYGKRKVLDVPELNLEKGTILGLLGPNGAGKTTLLEILSFLIVPSSGRIVYNGRPVTYGRDTLVNFRREVVLVPQTPILFTTTVYKNVEYGLKVRKIPPNDREKIIMEVLDLVGMRAFAQYPAHKLSGGETQRAAIARALACKPKVILMDEPTANVDVENQIAIEGIIRDINGGKGLSVILSTHNQLQAARLTSRNVFLFRGLPSSMAHENIFRANVEKDDNGRVWAWIQDRVRIPTHNIEPGQCEISLNPHRLSVAPQTDDADDRLNGKIVQIADQREHVRIWVDVGVPLIVLTNVEDYRQNRFQVGDTVHVVLNPESIEIL
jgi:tungstate transport system ATP-binding protein